MRSWRPAGAGVAVALALGAGLPGTAAAAPTTRYASPEGSAFPSECTAAASPCSLLVALGAAQAGDTLSLAGGTYDLGSVTLPPVPLHWAPTDPQTRPVLTSPLAAPTLNLTSAQSGTSLQGLEIDNTDATGTLAQPALRLETGVAATVRSSVLTGRRCVEAPDSGPLTIESSTLSTSAVTPCLALGAQSILRASSVGRSTNLLPELPPPVVVTQGLVEDSAVTGGLQLAAPTAVARRVRAIGAIGIFGAGLIADSLARGFGTDEAAIMADAPQGGTLRVVNSTALSTHGPALLAGPVHSATGPVTPNDLVATNTIARGQSADIQAPSVLACALGSFCDFGLIHIDHSDFATRSPLASAASARVITEGAGNIAGDPLFADAAGGDYHLRAGSPAIDAGAALDLALPIDLDGAPRAQGGAPDLGAFEVSPPAGPTGEPGAGEVGGGAGDGGAGPAGAGLGPDRAPPVLGRVHLSRARIRVAVGAGALGRAGRRVARSTTLTTTVSEAATMSFAIERATSGRRRGGSCVAPARPSGRAGRCTRWIARGPVLTRRVAAAGAVALAFDGRLGRHRLVPGRYRFAVSATDASGNGSATRFAALTIVA